MVISVNTYLTGIIGFQYTRYFSAGAFYSVLAFHNVSYLLFQLSMIPGSYGLSVQLLGMMFSLTRSQCCCLWILRG